MLVILNQYLDKHAYIIRNAKSCPDSLIFGEDISKYRKERRKEERKKGVFQFIQRLIFLMILDATDEKSISMPLV